MGKQDLTGNVFFRLTVIEKNGKYGYHTTYRCICECGNETTVRGNYLLLGHTKSCGCLYREKLLIGNRAHGLTDAPERTNYRKMIERCYDSKSASYYNYGAKGISVCERWRGKNGFITFYEDMGTRPTPIHSIDRFPDKKGNYGPDNCRWATPKEQNGNRTNNRIIEHAGMTMIIFDWAEYLGMGYCNLNRQLKKRSFEDIFNKAETKKTSTCKICSIKCPGPTPLCRKHYKLQWSRLSKGLIGDILEIPVRNLKKKLI